MAQMWKKFDESMLYPTGQDAIPYFILYREGEVREYKMVLGVDRPATFGETYAIRILADEEFEAITGMWAGELADLMDSGRMRFDLVFANDLIDIRKTEAANYN